MDIYIYAEQSFGAYENISGVAKRLKEYKFRCNSLSQSKVGLVMRERFIYTIN